MKILSDYSSKTGDIYLHKFINQNCHLAPGKNFRDPIWTEANSVQMERETQQSRRQI